MTSPTILSASIEGVKGASGAGVLVGDPFIISDQ